MKKRIIFASSATLLALFATQPVSANENTTETPVVSTEETTVADTSVETTEAIKQPELPNTGVESIAQYVVSGLVILGSAVGLLRKKGE